MGASTSVVTTHHLPLTAYYLLLTACYVGALLANYLGCEEEHECRFCYCCRDDDLLFPREARQEREGVRVSTLRDSAE